MKSCLCGHREEAHEKTLGGCFEPVEGLLCSCRRYREVSTAEPQELERLRREAFKKYGEAYRRLA